MGKTYEEFKQELRQEIIKKMNYTEAQVYYKEVGKGRARCERLLIEVAEHGCSKEVCGIPVENVYDGYLETGNLGAVAEWAVKEIEGLKEIRFTEKTAALEDYKKAKNRLFVRLLNADDNKEELQDAVCEVVGDIARVLYFMVVEKDGDILSVKVCRKSLEIWGLEAGTVMDAALMNTARIAPPRIYKWEKMIFNPEYDGEEIHERSRLEKGPLGNCLSTSVRTNGAVAVFLPGIAERIAELLGSDFYIVFTSIHEAMLHSTKTAQADILKKILEDTVRNNVSPEDYLTLVIYRYYRDSGSILPVRYDEAEENNKQTDMKPEGRQDEK